MSKANKRVSGLRRTRVKSRENRRTEVYPVTPARNGNPGSTTVHPV